MKIVLFEIRKNVLKISVLIPMLLLVVINSIMIFLQYRYDQNPFSDEMNKYRVSEKEWNYYHELHKKTDGELTEAKVEYIVDNYNKLYDKIKNDDYSTEYSDDTCTGYVFGDYSLVKTYFYEPIKYIVTYCKENEKIIEAAGNNITFYEGVNNKYEVEKNRYIVNQYSGRNPSIFYETTGWKKLLEYNFSDVLMIILIFLCILPAFYQERKSGMEDIILSAKKGKKMYIAGKYLAFFVCAAGVCAIFFLSDYASFSAIYGLNGAQMPIYTIAEYQYTPLNISVFRMYIVKYILKCMSFIVISTIFGLAANLSKNTIMTFLIFLGLTVLGLYCSGFIFSNHVGRLWLAMVSPFSLMKSQEVFKTLLDVKLFGHFYVRLYVCIVIQLIIESGLLMCSYIHFKMISKGSGRRYVY